MKIALLSSAAIVHTARWANALAQRGHEVHVFSAEPPKHEFHAATHVHRLPFARPHGYFLNTTALRRHLAAIEPDVLNSHFASGNATLGRRCGYIPHVVSIWGSDVVRFPTFSRWHRRLVATNLQTADRLCVTSHYLADVTRQLIPPSMPLEIVPFGVDCRAFRPRPRGAASDEVVIGTVKRLYPCYGIDLLIRGFADARRRLLRQRDNLADRLRLRICGDGPLRGQLQRLASSLGVAERTTFVGGVPHAAVSGELNRLDVYVAMSRAESFGVAVIEASACALPVVVSDAGGLPEVVRHGRTGIVVPRENPTILADALVELVRDEALRRRLGEAGRRYVQQAYDWPHNVSQMEAIYARFLPTRRQAA